MSKVNVWLRSKEKLLIVIICSVLMVVWIVGPSLGNLLMPGPVKSGRIFGKRVSGSTVHALMTGLYWILQPKTRQQGDLLYARAWDALILQAEAKRYGIRAGDAEIAAFLETRFPIQGGGYDVAAYRTFIRDRRASHRDYEDALRVLLTGRMLQQTVWESVTLPSKEAWLWYSRDKMRVKARYIELRAEDLARLVTVSEEELRAFYDEHAAQPPAKDPNGVGYLAPEKVKIEYIMAPYAAFTEQAVITERQIRAYYETHKEQYRLPKPAGSDKEAAEQKPAYRPLADVADAIERKLRQEEGERVADEVMKEVNEEIWKALDVPFGAEEVRSADLAAIAKKSRLTHRTTDFFSRDELAAVLPGAYELRSKAFGQGTSSIGRPSTTLIADEGKFVFQILDIQPPEPTPFEKIKDRVEKDLRLRKGFDLATEIAGKARSAPDFNAAARSVEEAIADADPKKYLRTGESAFFERPREQWGRKYHYSTGLPGQFNYANFADEAFALKEGEVGMAMEPAGPRAVFLLERMAAQPADRKEFEDKKAAIIRRLLDRKRAAVLRTWMADLRRRAHPSEEAMKFLVRLPQWSGEN